MAMLAIGGDDGIFRRQRFHHSHRIGFLSDIEVKETTNLLLAIKLGAALLEATDQHHAAQQPSRMLAVKMDF